MTIASQWELGETVILLLSMNFFSCLLFMNIIYIVGLHSCLKPLIIIIIVSLICIMSCEVSLFVPIMCMNCLHTGNNNYAFHIMDPSAKHHYIHSWTGEAQFWIVLTFY